MEWVNTKVTAQAGYTRGSENMKTDKTQLGIGRSLHGHFLASYLSSRGRESQSRRG